MKFFVRCRNFRALICVLALLSAGCAVFRPTVPGMPLSEHDIEICSRLKIDEEKLMRMKGKPIYEFSEQELGTYLGYLQEKIPELRERIQHLARKTVGQDYRIFLLGEFPFELYDRDPLYSLKESDCVVFSEHMYAMALGHDWPSFFTLLQRIRYRDGEIGMLTRNHYTIADWDRNNAWLVEDVTEELGGAHAVQATMQVNRARFFEKYGIGQDIPPETVVFSYIPYERLSDVVDRLQPGDFVNVIRGNEGGKYAGHVGLITRAADGTVNFLHSTPPHVIEQPLSAYVEARRHEKRRLENEEIMKKNEAIRKHNEAVRRRGRGRMRTLHSLKPYFYGFKFLRLREEPLEELRKIDGERAPRVRFISRTSDLPPVLKRDFDSSARRG